MLLAFARNTITIPKNDWHHYSHKKIFKIQEDCAFTDAGMLKIVQVSQQGENSFLWLVTHTTGWPSLCISHTKPNQTSVVILPLIQHGYL